MIDTMGESLTNIEWLTKQAAELRLRSNPCAGQTPLIIMADRFDNAVSEIQQLRARVSFLEGLFDFSDPEVVTHHAPNDPVTKDAVVVRLSHYETKR